MTCPLRSTGITPLHHYCEAVRPSPAHRYFQPRGWSRLCFFPWHRRPGSHVPHKSQIELRAAYTPDAAWAVSVHPPSLSRKIGQPPVLTSPTLFRRFRSGSLALASLNRTCRNPVPAFPQRSPPWLLTTAACGGLRSTPDCRPRRTFLHLSYSYATPCGPALLVTQGLHENGLLRLLVPQVLPTAMIRTWKGQVLPTAMIRYVVGSLVQCLISLSFCQTMRKEY
jgi:hypothetical protein